ncbi:Essential protein Yae1, N terminal [Thelotrema lepadinum]|nr:Essential protein Yae1, N terminal [Thelotrema lepadinum]
MDPPSPTSQNSSTSTATTDPSPPSALASEPDSPSSSMDSPPSSPPEPPDLLDDVFGSPDPDLDADFHSLSIGAGVHREQHPSDIPRLTSVHATAGYRDGVAAAREKAVQGGFDEGWVLGAGLGVRAGYVLGAMEGVTAAFDRAGSGERGSRGGQAGEGRPGVGGGARRRDLDEGGGVGEEEKDGVRSRGKVQVGDAGNGEGVGREIAPGSKEGKGSPSTRNGLELDLSTRAAFVLEQMRLELQITNLLSSVYINEDGTWKWPVEDLDQSDIYQIRGNGAIQTGKKDENWTSKPWSDIEMSAITFTSEKVQSSEIEIGEEKENEKGVVGIDSVAEAHPLIRKWSYIMATWAQRLGVDRENIMASLDRKPARTES